MATKAATEIAEALEIEGRLGLTAKPYQKLLGKERWELVEKCPIQPFSARHLVDLNEEPICEKDLLTKTKFIVATKGNYAIAYNTIQKQIKNKSKPFFIYTDLLGFHKLCVSGPIHLRILSRKIPELAWLLRNTNFDFGLFALAKMHPGSQFDFTVNWVEYSDKINAKAKAMGINNENRAFVAYKCNYDDYENKYKGLELEPKHDEKYYEKELKEAEEEARNERE